MVDCRFSASPITVLFILLTAVNSCDCRDDPCIASPSSCGHLVNITYPFRLTTDPPDCGNAYYEINCERNVPMLYYHSDKFQIRSINYRNYTIRLSDASFIPRAGGSRFFCNRSAALDARYDVITIDMPYSKAFASPETGNDWNVDLYQDFLIFSCSSQIPDGSMVKFVGNGICENNVFNSSGETLASHFGNSYWYVSSSSVTADEVMDSCRIELQFLTSLPLFEMNDASLSFKDVYDAVEYGFELSWFQGGCVFLAPTNEEPCFYLDHFSKEQYIAKFYSITTPKTFLRSILTKLATTPLAYLLRKLSWEPPLYLSMSNFDYLMAICHYILLLAALHQAPLFCVGAPLFIAFLVRKWRRRHLSIYDDIEDFLRTFDEFSPVRYSYSDIKRISSNFKEKLGEGGYGSVYKGKLRSGNPAAVKILGKGKAENGGAFISEVATIGRVRHVNIVRLIGFCAEGRKRALVYEFMPNGSLEKHIVGGEKEVSQKKMYEIALGVARGIDYLHSGCAMRILHFDIKPHNILLDNDFLPKISDFGLAKLYPADKTIASLTAVRGTLGYMAPECFYAGIGGVSHKSDVYSFGRMLMEMATRRGASSSERSSQIFLPSWVHEQLSHGREIELGSAAEGDEEVVKKMIIVALWCVQLRPEDRPSMHRVVEMLEWDVGPVGFPPKPVFAPPRSLAAEDLSAVVEEEDEEEGSGWLLRSSQS